MVINAGVPDYNMAQSMRFLEKRGADFHPDVVILSFYWDDLIPDVDTGDADNRGFREKPAPEEVRREWFAARPRLLPSRQLRCWAFVFLFTRSRLKHDAQAVFVAMVILLLWQFGFVSTLVRLFWSIWAGSDWSIGAGLDWTIWAGP